MQGPVWEQQFFFSQMESIVQAYKSLISGTTHNSFSHFQMMKF